MRRLTFFLSGFDPRGARAYQRLFQQEMKQQAVVCGQEIAFLAAPRPDRKEDRRWTVKSGDRCCDFWVLGWDDVVRQHWSRRWAMRFAQVMVFCRAYFWQGGARRLWTLSAQRVVFGLYPVLFLLLGVGLSVGIAVASLALGPFAVGGGLAIYGVWRLIERWGTRWGAFWLLDIYAFCASWGQKTPEELQKRQADFARIIAEACQDDRWDEVMVVSHSVGCMVALNVIAQTLPLLTLEHRKRLKIVTLGQCLPLLACHQGDGVRQFQQAVRDVLAARDVFWLDCTAPPDGACFPLLPMARACWLEETFLECSRPLLVSPRFFTLFAQETYRRMRRDWYRMHFAYLTATEKSEGYNFLNLTVGAEALDDFARRL